jgi:RIO-like serine/threonine protein kinase
MDMTDNYANQIGEGRSGTVYHGKLLTGQEVAVKVWAQPHSAAKEFQQFRRSCSKDKKKCEYVVQMIGYCDAEYEQISIYEYMPGGTLQHLHGEDLLDSKIPALDWKTRLKIALHIMQGNY